MYVKKMENVNRPRVGTLAELTEGNCFYISREHLVGEIAGYLSKWSQDSSYNKIPLKLFLASMKNAMGHSMLIYAAVYNNIPAEPDVNVVVDHFLRFAHHGGTIWLKECNYTATISLIYYKSLAECRSSVDAFLGLNVADDFASLDLYPVDGARKVVLFQD